MSFEDRLPSAPAGGEAAGPHPSIVALARFLVKIFYGKVEVVGLANVPRDRPLVFVANHVNSLVDPTLLIATMPVTPRFLGTSELWQMRILKPLLLWAAAIPVYRRQVVGFDREKNLHTFGRCHEVLAAGGHIAILPEGTSHNEPGLVPLRTGVSRIVLQAEARFGGLGIRIVPVGLTFEDRTRFRSAVLVLVGEPIDPAPQIRRYREQPREAVQALTERVRESLTALTLSFPSWEEAGLIERAVEIYQRPAADGRTISLSERMALRRAFIEGYRALEAERPAGVAEVIEGVRRYDAELVRHDLRDEDVAARYSAAQVARFTAESLWLVLIRLPLGLVGMLVHGLPFQAAALAARRLAQTADRIATYKVIASMVFYPLTWLALAVAAGWRWGWPAAALSLVLAPLCGGVALRLYLRSRLFFKTARAFLLLRSRRDSVAELRRLRGEAEQAVAKLVQLFESRAAPTR